MFGLLYCTCTKLTCTVSVLQMKNSDVTTAELAVLKQSWFPKGLITSSFWSYTISCKKKCSLCTLEKQTSRLESATVIYPVEWIIWQSEDLHHFWMLHSVRLVFLFQFKISHYQCTLWLYKLKKLDHAKRTFSFSVNEYMQIAIFHFQSKT